ncbi:MAG: hypothetical protein IJ708_15680 [Clostridia bacterium]|nr:hypothetical protein [Clostridia bacterium]
MSRRNTARLFEQRKGHLEYRIKRDYVRNGIATIPCHVSDYSDVINPYSVKDYETLNADFYDYLKESAEVTPSECPLVLNLIGDCLSQEEKKTIEEIIRDDFAYDLGIVEMEDRRHARIFWFMVIGLILSGTVLWFTKSLTEVPRELLFIPFWFMGETLCDYIFLTGAELRRERRLAGRLASIKVIFSECYEAPNYTESEVDKLYSEIEEGMNETILEEK